MEALVQFRVLSRLQAATILGGFVLVAGLVLWLGLEWIDVYLARLEELSRTNPDAAAAARVIHLKLFAIVQILPLTVFSGFMIWYCRRAIATQSMPPPGAWLIEGQRIRTGAAAVWNARALLGLTAAVALIGALEIGIVYYLAISLQAAAR